MTRGTVLLAEKGSLAGRRQLSGEVPAVAAKEIMGQKLEAER